MIKETYHLMMEVGCFLLKSLLHLRLRKLRVNYTLREVVLAGTCYSEMISAEC